MLFTDQSGEPTPKATQHTKGKIFLLSISLLEAVQFQNMKGSQKTNRALLTKKFDTRIFQVRKEVSNSTTENDHVVVGRWIQNGFSSSRSQDAE